MEFSEKLMHLRKKAGLSQEQLADRLGVTRQSVSKWESGAAVPELVKLIALSDMFGVSVDYLVKDAMEEPGEAEREAGGVSAARAERLERKVDDLADSCRTSWGPYYHYTSRARVFGLPLVCIRFGRDRHPSRNTLAVGVIAIGNFSVGVVSLGLISVGVVSLGMIAFGLLALGMVSIGCLALGVSAVGICGAKALAILGSQIR